MRALIRGSRRTPSYGRPCLKLAATAAFCLSFIPSRGAGAAPEDDWIAGSGLWTDASNWSAGIAPTGYNSGGIFSVKIDQSGNVAPAVSLPMLTDVYMQDLQIGATSSLSLQPQSALHINSVSGLNNAGSIALSPGAELVLSATSTISGGGTIDLSSGGFVKSSAPPAFTLGNQTLIAGTLDLSGWTNDGIIRNSPGKDMTLNGAFKNNGLIDQEGGGTLTITSSAYNLESNTGTIQVGPNSKAVLNIDIGGNLAVTGNGVLTGKAALVGGGSITNSSTGIIDLTGGFLDYAGSIINPAGGQIVIPGTLKVEDGNSVVNGGMLSIGGIWANQNATGSVFLRGGGTIVLSGSEPGFRSSPGVPIVNVDQTILGSGALGSSFVNDGTVEATNKMVVNGSQSTIVNNGIMGAGSGAQMLVQSPVVGSGGWNASGGTITFEWTANIATTGPISAVNGGRIEIGPSASRRGVLLPVTVAASNLMLDSTSSISNQGTLQLLGDFSYAMTDPTKWNWSLATSTSPAARLAMDGGINAQPHSAAGWARLELGEKDNGPNGPGYDTSFSIPSLEIGAGAHVLLVDLLDNGNRGGAAGAPEALYVDQLSFDDPTGQINLDGLHLYYEHLVSGNESQIIDEPVSVPEPGGMVLAAVGISCLLRRRRTDSSE